MKQLLEADWILKEAFPVHRKSKEKDDWDAWGVRDIALLSGPDGRFIKNSNGMLQAFYTGSTEEGTLQQGGKVVSADNGRSWQKETKEPVLSVNKGSWDGAVAASPWCIKMENKYLMYYRGSTKVNVNDAIGLAYSDDGLNFERYPNNPILTSKDFSGLRTHPSAMGVLNAVVDYDGNIIICFEANESENKKRGQIFAAKSTDGINFSPMNGGSPLFSDKQVKTWPVEAVCNPRIIRLEDGWFMLGFNGTAEGDYAIGIAFTKDFINWTEHRQNPILIPDGWPVDNSHSYRLEGPCFDRQALLQMDKTIDCFFMGIPFEGKNHQAATNSLAIFQLRDSGVISSQFRVSPGFLKAVEVFDEKVTLLASKQDIDYAQAHFIRRSSSSGSLVCSIDLLTLEGKKQFFIALSNSFLSPIQGNGALISVKDNRIEVWSPREYYKPNSGLKSVFKAVFRNIQRRIDRLLSNSKFSTIGRASLGQIDLSGAQSIELQLLKNKLTVSTITNGCMNQPINFSLHQECEPAPRIITLGAIETDLTIKVVEK